MADWRRRDVLAGLGVGAASALLWGCAAPARSALRAPAARAADDEVRAWLRDAVARLRPRFRAVVASAERGLRLRAEVDPLGARIDRAPRAGVVLRVVDRDGAVLEHGSDELTADGVAALVAALGGGAAAPLDVRATRLGAAAPPMGADADWLAAATALVARADAASSSRIVHRGGRVELDDVTRWVVTADRDVEVHRRRGRVELALVAWTGTRPEVTRVVRAAPARLGEGAITDAAIAEATAAALELVTPTPPPAGDVDVVLTAPVVAALALALADAAPPGLAAAPLRDASGDVEAYGGEPLDALGEVPEAGDLGGRARWRDEPTGPLTARAGHVAWAAGTTTDAALRADLGEGYQLERPEAVDVAADGVITLRVGCARRFRAGAPTGHVHAGVALQAPLAALLATPAATSRDAPVWIAPGDVPRSVAAPALRARGRLRAVHG